MKKIIILIVCAILLVAIGAGIGFLVSNKQTSRTSIAKVAEKARQKMYRSITVRNNTSSKYIAECNLYTKDGVVVGKPQENQKEKNIVFLNFDKNDAFNNETEFIVELVDRYGMKYEKEFSANKTGNTDVVVTEEDYVKQKGDTKRKMERAINE